MKKIPQIIYENKDILVIDKPAGLIVHSAISSPLRWGSSFTSEVGKIEEQRNTLVDFLLNRYPEMKKYQWPIDPGLPTGVLTRVGIVHRLDKDTSGLIVVAKNPSTLKFLQKQFKKREVEKTYLALVLGKVEPKEDIIKGVIGRDWKNRTKQRSLYLDFSLTNTKTRPAETHYKVLQYFTYNLSLISYNLTLLKVKPFTGRMHQIRVQSKHEGWPIIGDQVYNTKLSKKISQRLGLSRQFLHAHKLKIKLPNGKNQEFISDLPDDLKNALKEIFH